MLYSTKKLKIIYEDKIIEYPDFEIKAGDFVLVKGKSGSGKTSLIKTLSLLNLNYEGSLLFERIECRDIDESKRSFILSDRISYIAQENDLIEELTVKENIELGSRKKISEQELNRELEYFGLSGYENRKVGELSGGEKRRISIIKGILSGKDIVIIDEPFNFLNEDYRPLIIKRLYDLNLNYGKTVIFSFHEDLKDSSFTKIIDLDEKKCISLKDSRTDLNLDESLSKNKFFFFFLAKLFKVTKGKKYFFLMILTLLLLLLSFYITVDIYFNMVKNFKYFSSSVNEKYVYVIKTKHNLKQSYIKELKKFNFKEIIPVYQFKKNILFDSEEKYVNVIFTDIGKIFGTNYSIYVSSDFISTKKPQIITVDGIKFDRFGVTDNFKFSNSVVLDISFCRDFNNENLKEIILIPQNYSKKYLNTLVNDIRKKINILSNLPENDKSYIIYSGKVALDNFEFRIFIFGVFLFSFLIAMIAVFHFIYTYFFKLIFDEKILTKFVRNGFSFNHLYIFFIMLFAAILIFPVLYFKLYDKNFFSLSISVFLWVFYNLINLYLKLRCIKKAVYDII